MCYIGCTFIRRYVFVVCFQLLCSFWLILSLLHVSVLHVLAGRLVSNSYPGLPSASLSLSLSLFDVSVEQGLEPGRQPCPSAPSIKQWAGWQRQDDGQQRRGRCFAGTDMCSRPRGMSLCGGQRNM